MIAVPTRRPATTIATRDFRRPMFRAASRARSGRSPTTSATKAMPRSTATTDHSGRATASRPPRLFDDLPVPHSQDAVGSRADARIVRHDDERLALRAVEPHEEVHDLRRRLRVEVPG